MTRNILLIIALLSAGLWLAGVAAAWYACTHLEES